MTYERNILSRSISKPDTSLTKEVILFSRFLKARGFKIFSSNIIDIFHGLEVVDISRLEDFFYLVKSILVTNDLEWRLFDELFKTFWQQHKGKKEEDHLDKDEEEQVRETDRGDGVTKTLTSPREESNNKPEEQKEYIEGTGFSPVSNLEKTDLGRFKKDDIQFAQLILKNLMSPFAVDTTRRYKRSRSPKDMDFRRIIRESYKAGGLPLKLYYKKRKKKLKQLVILADVSGSMDRYARFVMPFILGLRGIGSKAEVFVFSTSLTPVSRLLKRSSIEKVLEAMSSEVPEWSGGTRIGYSFHQFNSEYKEIMTRKKTVVLILSDGWDLGSKEILKKQMEKLSRKAHSVIWLNPLAGEVDYRPVCKGMQIALPYVDHFLPANSLQNLRLVGRTLTKVMVS